MLKNDGYKNNVPDLREGQGSLSSLCDIQRSAEKEEYNKLAKAADFGHGGTDKTDIGKDTPYCRWAEESNFATRVDTSRRKCKYGRIGQTIIRSKSWI